MKKLLSLAFLSIVVISFTSCKKDDVSSSPAYVGTWTAETSFSLAQSLKVSVAPSFREKMVIGENDYSVTLETGAAGTWMALSGGKGSLTVAGDILTMTGTQDGEPNVAGVMVYTDIPTKDQEAMKAKWSVSGNQLTLIADENGDGDFNDVAAGDDSKTVYTKQ